MKRLHNTLLIVQFALKAIWHIWQEPKSSVTWRRKFKRVHLLVCFYNHLSDEEIEKSEL